MALLYRYSPRVILLFFEHYHYPEPEKHTDADERDRSDSTWAIEAGVMKMYPQLTREYIRDGISYVNLVMLQSVIPPYRTDKRTGAKGKASGRTKGKPMTHIDEFLLG